MLVIHTNRKLATGQDHASLLKFEVEEVQKSKAVQKSSQSKHNEHHEAEADPEVGSRKHIQKRGTCRDRYGRYCVC